MIEGRRPRRFGRGTTTLLPLRVRHISNTISCWYCDFKFTLLNEPLFRVGRKHARFMPHFVVILMYLCMCHAIIFIKKGRKSCYNVIESMIVKYMSIDRWLRVWFSMGIGFGMAALFSATMVGNLHYIFFISAIKIQLCESSISFLLYFHMLVAGQILIWETIRALYLGSTQFPSLFNGSIIGISPSVFGLSISLADAGYMCVSSIISVFVHELGHALAAASEGIQMEYIAAFLAGLFPGALVAFNYEQIQALPRGAALRVYCAGIWHNAAVCALSVLALFLLPLISYPFYVHGENLMVLDISPVSQLSEYLAPGDVIVSLNGIHMHDLQEWIETITSINEQAIKNVRPHGDIKGIMEVNDKRGYCVPNSLIEESMHIQLKEGMYIQPKEDQIMCPNEFTAFKALSCLGSSISNDDNIEDVELNKREDILCLSAKDIVKQKKCGGGWARTLSNVSSCSCSEVESCLTPVQMPSLTWLEITYSRPYFIECRQIGRNLLPNNVISDLSEIGCGGTFVFIGDINSMAHSLSLTEYQPRWSYAFGASLPHALEKLLVCTFYVSLGLALVNSLPVYLLDGESILDIVVCCLGFLSKRKRNTILQSCLFGGTVISILVLLRIFLAML